ncbi:DUF7919 family protein [Nocardia sp. IFM 10818]
MTYFEDSSPYSFIDEFKDGAISIGWLDEAEVYARGETPGEFSERLVELCRNSVNRTRGWHTCNLCPRPAGPMPAPTVTKSSNGDFPVGFGEIRVEGTDGVKYATPDMIAHYVCEHSYRPPMEFIEAVLQ